MTDRSAESKAQSSTRPGIVVPFIYLCWLLENTILREPIS